MNDKTKQVLTGFLALNDDERAEFMREATKVDNDLKKGLLTDSVIRKDAGSRYSITGGPVAGGCPCCGR